MKKDSNNIGAQFGEMKEWMGEEFGKINLKLDEHSKILDEHTDKIDALTAEMHQVQRELGALRDDLVGFKDKTDTDISQIREHINLPKAA